MYRGHLCCSLDTKSNEMINEWRHTIWIMVLDVADRCHLPSPQRMAAVASPGYPAEIIRKIIAYLDHAL